MRTNLLRSSLTAGDFVCSAELVLGRDYALSDAETFVDQAAADPRGVRIVSITDLPGGNPAFPPEAFSSYVSGRGLTPITHLSGKDGNRSFLEGRLYELARLGNDNVLALTGDAQKDGFAGRGKPVHDLDSVLILRLIEAMRSGVRFRLGSRELQSPPFDYFAGAVVNPFKVREPDLMMQLYKLELKIASGARFIITQVGFDLRKLYELRQYMRREGLDHVPVLANIYVPTATIARMMQSGELAGCVVADDLIRRLEKEKKPQRLERAALMVAAVRDLGFAGAHIGGFGLTHADVVAIQDRAAEIGCDWRMRLDELVFSYPGQFHLLPAASDGLSDEAGEYKLSLERPRAKLGQRVSEFVHRYMIAEGSPGSRFFRPRLKKFDEVAYTSRWCALLKPSSLYRKALLGCVDCGDCLQEHLNYVGCSMRWCYKELRNGPCGGSWTDGSCEARPELPCIWNQVYLGCRALGDDPRKFARTLVPPRDWRLDHTNSLVNRLAGVDNLLKRIEISKQSTEDGNVHNR
jgi:methylenetetrahydrofolate reductase (NADPH)